MRKGNERGAVVVEGLISLTTFMFTIFTILSIVNICFIQAKISVALNAAAKEISQYSYFYYKFGLDKADQKVADGTKDSRQLADNTIIGVADTISALSGATDSLKQGAFDEAKKEIATGKENVESLYTQYSERLKNDPKGFILGMGKMAANELKEEGKSALCGLLAKSFMSKNLVASEDDDPDAFLRRFKVVDGMDGLDFQYTTFLQNGTSNLIQLVVTYDVSVIKLLDLDFTFTFRQCAKVTAWGRGISQIAPEESMKSPPADTPAVSIWVSDKGGVSRGKYIVEKEKDNYPYADSGHGYDAYDNRNGKNEFVTIVSVDTNLKTYQDANQIRYKLNSEYEKLHSEVPQMGDSITVIDSNGNETTVTSNPDTRTYKIILVVPDDADMEVVNKAVSDFLALNPDAKIEVKTGYGTSKNSTADTSAENET